MNIAFQSDHQKKVYSAVLKCLRGIGYTADLIQANYEFNDWFLADAPRREVCAVFGQTPLSYDSACFAILSTVTPATPNVVADYRALGAPFALEIREDSIIPWRVGRDAQSTNQFAGRIPLDAIEAAFKQRESEWNPQTILRAKNIGTPMGPVEVDWIDRGLIPALEKEISTKLDRLLREALSAGQKAFHKSTGHTVEIEALYRLVFRFIAAKVFHDRRVRGFVHLDPNKDPREVLRAVCDFYKEPNNHVLDQATQEAVAATLWTRLGFQNLSVDALSLIAEDTLVDDNLRKEHGVHSTPRSIARYIVDHLPFDDIAEDKRIIVEPCSGHGVFLVAALKRLRDLLGPGWTEQERHRYFLKHLHGYEQDAFSREVCKLSLTLSDFPNPNGWSLHSSDVFTSRKFTDALAEARVILCNPPFEDFNAEEKSRYGSTVGTSKPHDVLQRTLRNCHPDARLGFVLPRAFVDGQSYRQIRRELTERFAAIDLVALPDKVFRHAEVETVLLLAHSPEPHDRVRIHFSEVLQQQRQHFLETGEVGRLDTAAFTATEAETKGFHVPAMHEIWERLAHLPKLGSIAEIHRGVEWQPPFDEAKYISIKQSSGWLRGLRNVEQGFEAFSPPEICWLNPNPKYQRGGAWSLPWEKPKVIANAATKSRTSWRLAAAPDMAKLVCTQRYHCLWPMHGWGVKALAALLNSPVVSAFVASREGKRDVRIVTLKDCPVPQLSPNDMVVLEGLVDDYLAALNEQPEARLELWGGGTWEQRAKKILLQMDALILKGYGLPPRLERLLLDFFRAEHRPVPFDFGDYFPADFTPTIPLWRFISPDFKLCNGRHLVEAVPQITDPILVEVLEEVL